MIDRPSGGDGVRRIEDGAGDAGAIDCREAVERVYEYLDGELEPDWAEKVRRHIRICRRCYPYFNFERIFLDHIRSRGLGAVRSRAQEEKVLALLREDA